MAVTAAIASFLPSLSLFGSSSSSKYPKPNSRFTPKIQTLIYSQQKQQESSPPVIPLSQHWMYEESEINGPDIWNNTWYPKAADHVTTGKTWYIVDATDLIFGRMASTISIHIRGKNLVTCTPSVDMGAFVIVVNAEKVAVSGKKRTQKLHRRHSGRPGGMKVENI